jgi:DNA-binding CsgD family transcriptional regulator
VRVAPRSLVGRVEELARLERLLAAVREGGSGALLIQGDPGVGKTALLERLIDSATGFRVVRATGVEGELDLPYAGLHQLCRPLINGVADLPGPQREALRAAFGLAAGDASDRYLVGLAALSLLSQAAVAQPLLCVVDDAQWLDAETVQALAFVARRLGADTVGLVIASRTELTALEGLDVMRLDGLGMADARLLLDSVAIGRLDGQVRERFLAETHGNPLGLLELPRALTPAEAATGVLRPSRSLSDRIEDGFRGRLQPLPDNTRRLLVLAAAEPLGDPLLLLRAASSLGLSIEDADAAVEAGLIEIRERTSFRHPLVRSAVYTSAPLDERRLAHGALAGATDPASDADRKAWHQAQATAAPDENIAAQLEQTAEQAKSRGGHAAAAAFLERAGQLTPAAPKRAERTLHAAQEAHDAGASDLAESLLQTIDQRQLTESQQVRAEYLDVVCFAERWTPEEAPAQLPKLLAIAEQLQEHEPTTGHMAYLQAFSVASYSGNPELIQRVFDAWNDSTTNEPLPVQALVLRGWALMIRDGFPAGTDILRDAMTTLRDKPRLDETDVPLMTWAVTTAMSLWDIDSWEVLARRGTELARQTGALTPMPEALGYLADALFIRGDLVGASAAAAEAVTIREVTRARLREQHGPWRYQLDGNDPTPSEAQGTHQPLNFWEGYAEALSHNASGEYEEAFRAAERSCDAHPAGAYTNALVELVEAASRCGNEERARAAFDLLRVRTQVGGTDWALGLEARAAALIAEDPTQAEQLYNQAIDHLQRSRTQPDLARAHLLYGEMLRRETRRVEAREHLRTAHTLFTDLNLTNFAERARRELAATGETARKRVDDTRADLTAHEQQIARLAAEGLTNPQIGAQLFLSPRTVEWHLRHIYPKLGISSRKELHRVIQPT